MYQLDKTKWSFLAGIFDGEGHISLKNRTGSTLGISQNNGLVFDEIIRLLDKFNIEYNIHINSYSDVNQIVIAGGFQKYLEVMGTIRPIRLIDNFKKYFSHSRASLF